MRLVARKARGRQGLVVIDAWELRDTLSSVPHIDPLDESATAGLVQNRHLAQLRRLAVHRGQCGERDVTHAIVVVVARIVVAELCSPPSMPDGRIFARIFDDEGIAVCPHGGDAHCGVPGWALVTLTAAAAHTIDRDVGAESVRPGPRKAMRG